MQFLLCLVLALESFTGHTTIDVAAGDLHIIKIEPNKPYFELSSPKTPWDSFVDSLQVAGWIKRALTRRFNDLLLTQATEADLSVGFNTQFTADIDNDGRDELIKLDHTYILLFERTGLLPRWILRDTLLVTSFATKIAPYYVNGDALIDLLVVDTLGNVWYYLNYGTKGEPYFMYVRFVPQPMFKPTDELAISPTFYHDTLWWGTQPGVLYKGKDTVAILLPYLSPVFYDYDGDGIADLLFGTTDGLYWVKSLDFSHHPELLLSGRYLKPAVGDIDTDGKPDLIVGDADGHVVLYRDFDLTQPESLLYDTSLLGAAPTCGDIDMDGKLEILVGFESGAFRVIDDGEVDTFPIYSGRMPSPTFHDIDHDGTDELIIGTLDGKIYCYKYKAGVWQEWQSFQPRMDRYRRFTTAKPFLIPRDTAAVYHYIKLIRQTPDKYKDEVTFTIAFTPPEILKTMARLGYSEIIIDNVRLLHQAANFLPYVDILDMDSVTTLTYKMEDGTQHEIAPEIYYFWVVHPRVLYEVPAYVKPSYWFNPPEYYGLSYEEWVEHKPDSIFTSRTRGHFWRKLLMYDTLWGNSIRDILIHSSNLRAAVDTLFSWIHNTMTFGYRTQDYQPLIIYAKRYGSCGEYGILSAAILRTGLIPVRIAVDRGEDHQWDEIYIPDEGWMHWDATMERGLAHPYVSAEGMNKDVSAVTSWRCDDILIPITGPYTGTAKVEFKVMDKSGRPIDGALIVLRSHWREGNAVTIWGYTDSDGIASFDIGYEPLGYTVEILTPIGFIGSENLFVEEGKSYKFQYSIPVNLPQRIEGQPINLSPTDKYLKLNFKVRETYQRLENLLVQNRESLPRHDPSHTFYLNQKPAPIEVYVVDEPNLHKLLEGAPFTCYAKTYGTDGLIDSLPLNYTLYVVISNRNSITTNNIVEVDLTVMLPPDTPQLVVKNLTSLDVPAGATIKFDGIVKDRGNVKLWIEKDGTFLDSVPLTQTYVAKFSYELSTGAGGPWLPDTHKIVWYAMDESHSLDTATFVLILHPTSKFDNQPISQDNPDDPKTASWRYGPLKVDTVRLLWVKLEGIEPREGMDLDLFLYRVEDGELKRVASSTSPTAEEKIFHMRPQPGIYWIYVHGWRVAGEGRFHLRTSFVPTTRHDTLYDVE